MLIEIRVICRVGVFVLDNSGDSNSVGQFFNGVVSKRRVMKNCVNGMIKRWAQGFNLPTFRRALVASFTAVWGICSMA